MKCAELSLVARTVDRLLAMVGAPVRLRHEILKRVVIGDDYPYWLATALKMDERTVEHMNERGASR